MEQRILNKFKKMSRNNKDIYALTLVKLLDHLKQNLKDADMNDSYRRREVYRTEIAIGAIEDWIKQAGKKLTLDKNKK
jgi:hypothetical protein